MDGPKGDQINMESELQLNKMSLTLLQNLVNLICYQRVSSLVVVAVVGIHVTSRRRYFSKVVTKFNPVAALG